MSSGCGDVLSLEDLRTAKKHQTFEAEVITGRAGGVSSGAEIDFATNQVTGQVQKTLPAILRDLGFNPVSFDFTTGGTLTIADRNSIVYNPADSNWYSWSGTLPHVVAPGSDPTADVNWKPRTDQLLRQELASVDGSGLVGWKRSVISKAVASVSDSLDGYVVSIWEFASLITDKPDPDNYETWDWSPATQAALDYCTKYRPLGVDDNYYQTISLRYPGGYYLHKAQVTGTNQASGGATTFATTIKISGDGKTGTTIASALSGSPLFYFTSLRVCIEDIAFTRHLNTANVQFLKLGDENAFTPCSHSTFRNIVMSNATKAIIIGQLFDSTFQSMHIIGARPAAGETPVLIDILPHVSDSTNQLTFLNIVLETAYSDDAVMFRAEAKSIVTPHHSIHWFGGHFETVFRGAECLSLTNCAFTSFNGVNFVSNGSNTHDPATQLTISTCTRVDFRSCYFLDNNAQSTFLDSNKRMVDVDGTTNNLLFESCFWATPYNNVSTHNRNWDTIFGYSGATYGAFSFNVKDCGFNDYKFLISTQRLDLSAYDASNRIWRAQVLTGSEPSYVISYGNDIYPQSQVARLIVDQAGTLKLPRVAGGVDVSGIAHVNQSINIGDKNTVAGDRYVNGYTAGSDTLTQQVKFTGNNITFTANYLLPSAAGGTSIGNITYPFKDITLQNAPIVVSDRNKKTDIQPISEIIMRALSGMNFSMYKMKQAISEKGEEAARYHFGVIAQDIIDAFSAVGLSAADYGVVCYTSWGASEAVYQVIPEDSYVTPEIPEIIQDGVVIQEYVPEEKIILSEATTVMVSPAIEAGEGWTVRYEELLSLECAYQRWRLSQIEASLKK